MADHGLYLQPLTRPIDNSNSDEGWTSAADNDNDNNSCNLSASWIDLQTTDETDDDESNSCSNNNIIIESLHAPLERNEEQIRVNLPIVVKDLHFDNLARTAVSNESKGISARGEECSVTPTNEYDCYQRVQKSHPQNDLYQQQDSPLHQETKPLDPAKSENTSDKRSCNQRYVEIIDTHCETIEGYDWEGILDLRNRMRRQQEQQQEGVTAVRYVTNYKLYLTDGLLEQAMEDASSALDYAPSYNLLETGRNSINKNTVTDGEHLEESLKNENGEEDFEEFIESPKPITNSNVQTAQDESLKDDDGIEEQGYATPALSPLDVLTNSLLGARAFHARYPHPLNTSIRLAELVVGGHSLELGESSIERLASALACSGGFLKRLVLNVSAVDLRGMKALADCFRANSDSLEDLHFYASKTTERLVGSRNRYTSVPAPCVLGPGISSWVDAWTSGNNQNNSLRSLNLSRMDIGDEAAFALSRLLLAVSRLEVLNLAQDDLYGCPKSSHLSQTPNSDEGNIHTSLSFAGTKRLLESIILVEDIKKRSLSSLVSQPLSCSSLVELDISGWVLEDDESETYRNGCDEDDEKAVDDFYDDFNFIDDGTGEDGFEFADFETGGCPNVHHNRAIRRNQRACCVIASMIRCNTTLRKLVLVAEDGTSDTNTSGIPDTARRSLSVRSTLAIARALRDHVGKGSDKNNRKTDKAINSHHFFNHASLGSNLRTLVLSTDYTRGMTARNRYDTSSWAITERKRAVAKVFYRALKDRSIHELRLQELSFTRVFRGLEPFGADPRCADVVEPRIPGANLAAATDDEDAKPSAIDLRDELEFLLQRNRAFNLSLENIDSFWLPMLSTLRTKVIIDARDANEGEYDCHFVETIESDANATQAEVAAAAAARQLKRLNQTKIPPPVEVLVLPTILARANQEAARHDVVFFCARFLARRTNIWELSAEYRCDKPIRNETTRYNRDN